MISRPSRGLISSVVAIAIDAGIGTIAMSPWKAWPSLGSKLRTCIGLLLALRRGLRPGCADDRRIGPPPGLRTRQQDRGQSHAAIGETVERADHAEARLLPKPHLGKAGADRIGRSLALPIRQHDLAAGAAVNAEVLHHAEHAAGQRRFLVGIAHRCLRASSRPAAVMTMTVRQRLTKRRWRSDVIVCVENALSESPGRCQPATLLTKCAVPDAKIFSARICVADTGRG